MADRNDDEPATSAPGPGIEWVARKTGRSPAELTASPNATIGALGDALRETAERLRQDSPKPGGSPE